MCEWDDRTTFCFYAVGLDGEAGYVGGGAFRGLFVIEDGFFVDSILVDGGWLRGGGHGDVSATFCVGGDLVVVTREEKVVHYKIVVRDGKWKEIRMMMMMVSVDERRRHQEDKVMRGMMFFCSCWHHRSVLFSAPNQLPCKSSRPDWPKISLPQLQAAY